MNLVWVLLFVVVEVNSSGILIKSGVAQTQGVAQSDNAEDVKFQKGTTNYEGEAGFNKDAEKKAVLAQDAGQYGEEASKKNIQENANNFNKENYHQTLGDNLGNFEAKQAHQKGHHKSGFSNSYHKDETGSNTSFFEDGSDEGGLVHRKNFQDTYGDTGHHQLGGNSYDASNLANEQARRGVYDNSGRYEKDYGNNRNYNRNNYYDAKENLARRNLANNYDGGHRYSEDEYAQGPPPPPVYYAPPLPYGPSLPPPPPPPPVQKHHITIYEDPRYVPTDVRYRRSDGYGDDYVELDVRSPAERDQRVRYYEQPDYWYYD